MVIFVTGTRTGIGRWAAQHLLRLGHAVIGCSRRTPSDMPDGYVHFETDLTDSSAVKTMFRAVRESYGRIDALINNAGTATMCPFMLTPDQEIRRIFDVNVFSVMQCCREAIKLLRGSTFASPSIVNLSSVATLFSIEGELAYAASKAAVEQMTRTLSREAAGLNIRVNAIGLPPIRTFLTTTVDPEKINAVVARQAIKRMCSFEDIAGPLEFLLSSSAGFVTGETIYLGGVR